MKKLILSIIFIGLFMPSALVADEAWLERHRDPDATIRQIVAYENVVHNGDVLLFDGSARLESEQFLSKVFREAQVRIMGKCNGPENDGSTLVRAFEVTNIGIESLINKPQVKPEGLARITATFDLTIEGNVHTKTTIAYDMIFEDETWKLNDIETPGESKEYTTHRGFVDWMCTQYPEGTHAVAAAKPASTEDIREAKMREQLKDRAQEMQRRREEARREEQRRRRIVELKQEMDRTRKHARPIGLELADALRYESPTQAHTPPTSIPNAPDPAKLDRGRISFLVRAAIVQSGGGVRHRTQKMILKFDLPAVGLDLENVRLEPVLGVEQFSPRTQQVLIQNVSKIKYNSPDGRRTSIVVPVTFR